MPPSSRRPRTPPFQGGNAGSNPVGGTCDAVSRSTQHSKALWRSWLARRPVTAEVAGSSPVRVARTVRHMLPSGQVAQSV